jgi:hypothetical protein
MLTSAERIPFAKIVLTQACVLLNYTALRATAS